MNERNQCTGVLTASGPITALPAKLVGWTARVIADSTIQVFQGSAEGTDADIVSELDIPATEKSGGVMGINVASPNGFYLKIAGQARVSLYFRKTVTGG
jgi:hypothetical protein